MLLALCCSLKFCSGSEVLLALCCSLKFCSGSEVLLALCCSLKFCSGSEVLCTRTVDLIEVVTFCFFFNVII